MTLNYEMLKYFIPGQAGLSNHSFLEVCILRVEEPGQGMEVLQVPELGMAAGQILQLLVG